MPHGATRRRPGDLSTERWAKQSQKVASQKSGAEHSIQRHSSSPTRLSGGCAKPIFDHAHERSAKRQGKRGLILCPLSSNLPCRARRVELRLQQRRKTEEAGFELSVPRDMTKVLKTPEVASARFPVTRNSGPRTGTEAGQGRWRSSAGPRVRIRLPPALSHVRTRGQAPSW